MNEIGVVFDAGPFIALERRNPVVVHLVKRLLETRTPIVTSAGVLAQVWRGGGGRQAPIAHVLRHTEVFDLTASVARILGRMLGEARGVDPIDAHVVLLARQRDWPVLTSDEGDLRAIDPRLRIERE